jgi:hypothetical protein
LVYPCHRAVALTPPEWSGASVSLRRPMQPSPYGSELGFLWGYRFSRPNLRSLSLRPDDLLTILKMALSIGIRHSISLLSAIQATRPLTITLVGLSPTEHTSFFLDTLPYGGFSPVRFQGRYIRRCLPVDYEFVASHGLPPSFVHLATCNAAPSL